MFRNTFTAILGVVAATSLFAGSRMPAVGTKIVDPKTGIEYVVVEVPTTVDGTTTMTKEFASLTRSATRRPLEPEATKRLHDGPVIISSLFEASGRGDWAGNGIEIRGSYIYNIGVTGRSEVVTCETSDAGRMHVVERRKFLSANDELVLRNIDAALALDTIPVEKVCDWTIRGCGITATVATYCGHPEIATGAGLVAGTVATWYHLLEKIDGVSARAMLGAVGVEVPDNIDRWISNHLSGIAKERLDSLHVCIQSITGKSFLITYEQEASGKPMDISYRNEDGSPISDAEWEILRQANLFLDQDIVPNTRCRVGDSWKVWADEVQELFGVAGSGRAEGQILVTRIDDQPNGDWTLSLSGTEVTFRSDDGTVAGKMKVKDGNGLVDSGKGSVKMLHTTATGDLRAMNKKRHAMFFDFVKRLKGDANLRFSLACEPSPEKAK